MISKIKGANFADSQGKKIGLQSEIVIFKLLVPWIVYKVIYTTWWTYKRQIVYM